MHVHLYINGSSVMLSDPYPEHGHPYVPAAGFSLMLPVATWTPGGNARWMPAAPAIMPPQDMFWGDRYAQVQGSVRRDLGVRRAQKGLRPCATRPCAGPDMR